MQARLNYELSFSVVHVFYVHYLSEEVCSMKNLLKANQQEYTRCNHAAVSICFVCEALMQNL